jgi:hypothetical protein
VIKEIEGMAIRIATGNFSEVFAYRLTVTATVNIGKITE